MGLTASLFAAPAHSYTRAPLSAVPVPNPNAVRIRLVLDPSSFNPHAPLRVVADRHLAAV